MPHRRWTAGQPAADGPARRVRAAAPSSIAPRQPDPCQGRLVVGRAATRRRLRPCLWPHRVDAAHLPCARTRARRSVGPVRHPLVPPQPLVVLHQVAPRKLSRRRCEPPADPAPPEQRVGVGGTWRRLLASHHGAKVRRGRVSLALRGAHWERRPPPQQRQGRASPTSSRDVSGGRRRRLTCRGGHDGTAVPRPRRGPRARRTLLRPPHLRRSTRADTETGQCRTHRRTRQHWHCTSRTPAPSRPSRPSRQTGHSRPQR
mmetsp:Transcript_4316/g.14019  ORF Transcript_4316/g.14019 Transcript_4316/m.14019 type:complete len:259 (+) Transcript_4316:665-1441(+)